MNPGHLVSQYPFKDVISKLRMDQDHVTIPSRLETAWSSTNEGGGEETSQNVRRQRGGVDEYRRDYFRMEIVAALSTLLTAKTLFINKTELSAQRKFNRYSLYLTFL
jgi:hypothetical protein